MRQPTGLDRGRAAGRRSTNSRAGRRRRPGADRRDPLPVHREASARATTRRPRLPILEVLGIDGGRTLAPSGLPVEVRPAPATVDHHVTEPSEAGSIVRMPERGVRGTVDLDPFS